MKPPIAQPTPIPFDGNAFFAAMEGYSDGVVVGYLRALWAYWEHTHCTGLPDDDDYLRRLCRCDPASWARTRGIIFDGGAYFTLLEGKWHQGRARLEYEAIMELTEKKKHQTLGARQARGVTTDVTTVVTKSVFEPPTLEMVKLQGSKIGLPVHECEKFHSYYESNGWRVGRNPMKNWQMAMVHWKSVWRERPITDKSVAVAQVAAAAGTSRTLKTLDRLIEQH